MSSNGSTPTFLALTYQQVYQLRNLANTPQTQALYQLLDELYASCIESKKTPDGSDLSVVLMVISDRSFTTAVKK